MGYILLLYFIVLDGAILIRSKGKKKGDSKIEKMGTVFVGLVIAIPVAIFVGVIVYETVRAAKYDSVKMVSSGESITLVVSGSCQLAPSASFQIEDNTILAPYGKQIYYKGFLFGKSEKTAYYFVGKKVGETHLKWRTELGAHTNEEVVYRVKVSENLQVAIVGEE